MKQQFTRYLYLYEEVELSLLLSLLNKQNLDKVLFWCYELYYSSPENNIFPFLIKIYFDFYALKNPKFYDYITKNYDKWKDDKDVWIVGNICKNLFGFNYNCNVFLIRQCHNTVTKDDIILYRGRKPQWISKFDKKFHNLYMAINKREYKYICYYLKTLKGDSKDKFLAVIDYFEKVENATIRHENIMTSLKHYDNFEHYVFYSLMLLFDWITEVNEKKIYSTLNNEEKDEIISIQEDEVTPKYKTLQHKRKYKLSKGLGCFDLIREKIDLKNKMYYHWLYYCSDNAYWKPLLDKYTYKKNEVKEEIEFENDDMLEEFFEKYGYLEPDEQDCETQEKATCNIETKSWKVFTASFSDYENFINFKDEFKFKF